MKKVKIYRGMQLHPSVAEANLESRSSSEDALIAFLVALSPLALLLLSLLVSH